MEVLGREEGLTTTLGVYVHVPWCASKCPYCDFNSAVRGVSGVSEDGYIDAVTSELGHRASIDGLAGTKLKTLYFGGGTPTVLAAPSVGRVIDTAAGLFTPEEGMEITVEANPDSAGPEKLRGLVSAGANRLSLGVQSLDAKGLRALGRPHTPEDAIRAFSDARDAGFTEIGVDLIFAYPGQTLDGWARALERTVALGPEHISVYGLTIEEGTPFSALYGPGARNGEHPALPGSEDQARMYELAVCTLADAGYSHYEISNFARPGSESRHNLGYWLGRDYIGVGAGAHSFLSTPGWGRRWWNVPDPARYARLVSAAGGAVEGAEELTRDEALTEAVMLGLRMCRAGLDAAALEARFGAEAARRIEASLAPLAGAGFVEYGAGAWRLTARGLLVADSVVETAASALSGGAEGLRPGARGGA